MPKVYCTYPRIWRLPIMIFVSNLSECVSQIGVPDHLVGHYSNNILQKNR